MNSRRNLLIAIVTFRYSIDATAQGSPQVLGELLEKAKVAWVAGRYRDFAMHCKAIEAITPDFAAGFNVALGLFRAGDNASALSKAIQVQQMDRLDRRQTDKIEKLRKEIEGHLAYLAAVRERRSGSVTLSRGAAQPPGAKDCSGGGRSARCTGPKPDQVEEYMATVRRETAIANGYNVPATNTKSEPE